MDINKLVIITWKRNRIIKKEDVDMKKIFAIVLCVALLSTSFPTAVFAETGNGNEDTEAVDTENSDSSESRVFEDAGTGIVVTTGSNVLDEGTKLVVESVESDEIYRIVGIDYIAYNIYFESENGEQIETDDLCTISIPVRGNKPDSNYVMQAGYIINQRVSELEYRYENGVLTFNDTIRGNAGTYVISSISTNIGGFRNVLGENVEVVDRQLVWIVDSVVPRNVREASALMSVLAKDTEYYSTEVSFIHDNVNEALITIIPKTDDGDRQTRFCKITYNQPSQERINEARSVAKGLNSVFEIEGIPYSEYSLEDMSLINFYLHNSPYGQGIDYVNEIRDAINGNSDIEIKLASAGGGTLWDCDSLTELTGGTSVVNLALGTPIILNDGIPCCIPVNDMYSWRRNVIYVPENVANPYELAKERLAEYLQSEPGEWYQFKPGGKISNLNHRHEDGTVHDVLNGGDIDRDRLADDDYYILTMGEHKYIFLLYKTPAEKITTPEFVFSDSDTGLKFTSGDAFLPLDAKMEASCAKAYGTINYNLVCMRNNGERYSFSGNCTVEIPKPDEIDADKLEIYGVDSNGDNILLKHQVKEDKVIISDWLYFNEFGEATLTLQEAEYSDIFEKAAPDGTVTFNSITPGSAEEFSAITLYLGRQKVENGYSLDFNLIEEGNYEDANMTVSGESYKESHRVKIEYKEPDEEWVEEAKEIKDQIKPGITGDWSIDKIPYSLEDAELLNYLKHRTVTENNWCIEEGSNIPTLYLSEIRNIVENPDVYFVRSLGAGDTLDIASEMASYDEGYYLICQGEYVCAVGKDAIAKRHIIYIPDDSKDIMTAAKERLDDCLGEGEYSFTVGGKLNDLKWHNESTGEDEKFNSAGAFDREKIAGDSYYHLTINDKTYQFLIYKMPAVEIPSPVFNETDEATNVSVISDGSSLPLDAKLTVNANNNDKLAEKLGTDNYTAFDIEVISHTYGGKIKKVDGKITVKLPLSAELKDKDLGLYFISEKGVKKEYDFKIENGYALAETDEIGTYALAEKESSGDDKPTNPGDKPTNPGDNNPGGGNHGGTGGSGGSGSGGTSVPSADSDRVAGANRFQTAINVANQLKKELGVVKFNNIVVANSDEFADALSATALASAKKAPILVVNENNETTVKNYITANLVKGGNVYIIGGTAAVTERFEGSLTACKVTRLGGSDRYATNLAVLKALGVTGASDIMVASGSLYPDALSASATGNPVLLVGKTLTDAQKDYLATLGGNDDYYVIGGTVAVNATVMNQLKASKLGDVVRLEGINRFETGLAVAEEFFLNAKTVVVASGDDFPDGLTGGVLANAMDAPMMLINQYNTTEAADFVDDNNVKTVVAIGGTTAISNATLNKVA